MSLGWAYETYYNNDPISQHINPGFTYYPHFLISIVDTFGETRESLQIHIVTFKQLETLLKGNIKQ